MDILKVLSRGTKRNAPKSVRRDPNSEANRKSGSTAFDAKWSSVSTKELPSAGAVPRPQLFHDDVGDEIVDSSTKSETGELVVRENEATPSSTIRPNQKRKRDGRMQEAKKASLVVEENLTEFDFFATTRDDANTTTPDDNTHSVPSQTHSSSGVDGDRNDEDEDEDGATTEVLEEMSMEECKKVLQSHRLKFLLLSNPLPTLDASTSNDKKKKRKHEDKKKKKNKKSDQPLTKDEEKTLRQYFPRPLLNFGQLRSIYGLSPLVATNLEKEAYKEPTEVQLATLTLLTRPEIALAQYRDYRWTGHVPRHDKESKKKANRGDDADEDSSRPLLSFVENGGVDLLAIAPTGSGKTMGFLIPTIHAILQRRRHQAPSGAPSPVETQEEDEHELEAIVLAPTRELAYQIVHEARKITAGTNLRVALMRKGMRLASASQIQNVMATSLTEDSEEENGEDEDQDSENDDSEDEEEDSEEESEDEPGEKRVTKKNGRKSKNKVGPLMSMDILVATPKLLQNYLQASSEPNPCLEPATSTSSNSTSATLSIWRTLPSVRHLIIDEADVLLDKLFRDQTVAVWNACTHPLLRHTFWSATMASGIETFIKEQLEKRYEQNRLGGVEDDVTSDDGVVMKKLFFRLVVGLKDAAVPNIRHKLIYTGTEPGKLYTMRQFLRPASGADNDLSLRPPFLVFTQTIERAAALQKELQYDIPLEAGGSARIASLHSDLPDAARAKVMRQFRAGEIWVLITTDLLARGIDFAGVNGVVNYDIPTTPATYIHRAGRTGRVGREGGVAVTFWTKDDIPYVRIVANVIQTSDLQAGRPEQNLGVPRSLMDALPNVSAKNREQLKRHGVQSRQRGKAEARITTMSGWERKREHNRHAAVEHSKKQKKEAKKTGNDGTWGGFDD